MLKCAELKRIHYMCGKRKAMLFSIEPKFIHTKDFQQSINL